MFQHFQNKDLGRLKKYFLRIEVDRTKSHITISQRKYALDILEETQMFDCKSSDTSIDPNTKLMQNQGSLSQTICNNEGSTIMS